MPPKRSYSPSVQDRMLLQLKEPVPLPEAKDVNDFIWDPQLYPELSEEFVRDLLEISSNQACERNLLKITMLARALKAHAEHGAATDGNIVIISFDLFIQSSNEIFFCDVEKNK